MSEMNFDQLQEYAANLESHINQSVDFTEGLRHIRYVLENMKYQPYLKEIRELREEISLLREQFERAGLPKIDIYNYKLEECEKLLKSEEWPMALAPTHIYRNEIGEQDRAENIMTLVVQEYMDDKSFLDYGCGLGYTTNQARIMGASISVGYDPVQSGKISPQDNLVFTSDLETVKAHAPYDVVLLYDVLDHCLDPMKELAFIREHISERGRIYVRTHPWCSRHGGHLYEQFNKAFVHLVFDEIELSRIAGIHTKFIQRLTQPEITYEKWFETVGLEVMSKTTIEEDLEEFFFDPFNHPSIRDRIMARWKGENPMPHMRLSFIDYVLEARELYHQIF